MSPRIANSVCCWRYQFDGGRHPGMAAARQGRQSGAARSGPPAGHGFPAMPDVRMDALNGEDVAPLDPVYDSWSYGV